VGVGAKCTDYPQLRAELSDCLHCHVDSDNGDATPRLKYRADDGDRYIPLGKVRPDNLHKVKAAITTGKVPPAPPQPGPAKPTEVGRAYAVPAAPVLTYAPPPPFAPGPLWPQGQDCQGPT
jgi:hypothetical protein